jgi:hypothetical protein
MEDVRRPDAHDQRVHGVLVCEVDMVGLGSLDVCQAPQIALRPYEQVDVA